MIRYRKRPVVIEAAHWDGTAAGATPIIDWILDIGRTATYEPAGRFHDASIVIINTLEEGAICASGGDWIIRGVADEFHPCKPDIFAATYEPAGDDE